MHIGSKCGAWCCVASSEVRDTMQSDVCERETPAACGTHLRGRCQARHRPLQGATGATAPRTPAGRVMDGAIHGGSCKQTSQACVRHATVSAVRDHLDM